LYSLSCTLPFDAILPIEARLTSETGTTEALDSSFTGKRCVTLAEGAREQPVGSDKPIMSSKLVTLPISVFSGSHQGANAPLEAFGF
jgi:hypothetical protein